ncbi:LOW QUALITY PROTEIN: polyprotein [Phytophthora megakarya]|uniref:Polyprotein n=1 Tax=Phytophthora megakarya TaxID=4795 RepID=A0A225X1K1_9STRA|nr:LOW QUALITY PROTEIN: polyprotein [Phytophthora megakarya]
MRASSAQLPVAEVGTHVHARVHPTCTTLNIVHHIAPMDMTTQVHVFISGINAGYQCFYLTKKAPSTVEEAFAVALRENYSVSTSIRCLSSLLPASESGPEPMEVDAIQHYGERRQSTFSTRSPSTHTSRPMKCFRCCKPGHRAAVCRAPAPVMANIASENDVAVASIKRRQPVEPPPSPPVLHAQLSTTTSGSDSRLIVLSLHVDGAKRSIRTLLDSGAANTFVRAESLSVLPTKMSIREGPGEVCRRQAAAAAATLGHLLVRVDGFRGSDDFMVIELGGSFDCIFGIPWLARHQPHIDWLTKTVRPRDID